MKVRYRCLPGLTELQGRTFTDVIGRMDHKEFHVNRLHESPHITDDSDGYKTEAKIFLNDGEDCDGHKNCGRNRRGSYDLNCLNRIFEYI